jgi:hypothetical protein
LSVGFEVGEHPCGRDRGHVHDEMLAVVFDDKRNGSRSVGFQTFVARADVDIEAFLEKRGQRLVDHRSVDILKGRESYG